MRPDEYNLQWVRRALPSPFASPHSAPQRKTRTRKRFLFEAALNRFIYEVGSAVIFEVCAVTSGRLFFVMSLKGAVASGEDFLADHLLAAPSTVGLRQTE